MTIVTKPIVDKKDEKAFLNEFEGPPNVAVTVPSDAVQVPISNIVGGDEDSNRDETDTLNAVRIHNRAGGFKFIFLIILVVTALTSGFCFFRALHVAHYRRGICRLPFDLRFFDDTTLISGSFSNNENGLERTPKELGGSLIEEVKETINEKVVEEADGKIGLEYEIDVETETFEMFQMPQLSRGKYLHDFKMNKTLIIDTDNNVCFIMPLDRKEIEPPRDFMEFINRLNNGIYQLDLDEVRHDTRVVLPPLEKVDMMEYGFHIANQCRRKSSYLLEDVAKVLVKRSATPAEGEVGKKFNFIEFGGKHFIKYNIVNIDDLN